MVRVGMIGAGRMGQPMIGHLVRKGHEVVVHDIDAGKRPAVEKLGGKWQPDAAEVARTCEVILVCVGFDRELRDLLSATGSLRDAPAGTIVAVLATVHPGTMVELAGLCARRGVRVADSPVCRGGKAADEGTLLSFVGGSADDFSRLAPVLSCFCSDRIHAGPVGTGQVAKAANNMVMWSCLIADHEALALAQRYGMDPEMLRAALQLSSADNYVLRNWRANTMAWAEDDMEIVQQMAAERGIALPQAGLNRELCRLLKPRRFKLDEYGL